MNDLNNARHWHGEVSHLVQAHGADPARLIAYTPTLEQARFVHFDTHAALEIAYLRPPDRHAHPAPVDPGWSEPRPPSYRPFPPSATALENLLFTISRCFPLPSHTGLPQTAETPATEADLAGWASVALGRSLARAEWLGQTPAQATADYYGYIREHAAAAQARWLATGDFPSPVQTRPSIQASRGGAAELHRRSARTAGAARQARPRSRR